MERFIMIEVCRFNLYFEELTAALEANNIGYTTKDCLGRCDLCHSSAFVKYQDEFISEDSVENLIKRLRK
jgi:uncharacterized protein YuzB (UPF0349 family)